MPDTRTPLIQIPGVYLQQEFPIVKAELRTGVPVFLGIDSSLKDEDQLPPQKLTLWHHFQQSFKQPSDYLKHAVRGFFENGGRLCYVISLNSLEKLQNGLILSEALDEVDLVCVPDLVGQESSSNTVIFEQQATVLEHCEQMGDRFAILDAVNQATASVNEQRQYFRSIKGAMNGALYAPWLKVEHFFDCIPPCGHIAGLYARFDHTFGVHHAPANMDLEGILDLERDLSADQALLNPENQPGVNCIRAFRGRGIRVGGVRTLSSEPQWRSVNVRRLFLTVGRWINLHLASAVFEPNDPQLWLRLERELGVYCESLWRQGALQGATSREAFYVRCNAETNPPALRDTGQVRAELGLAPTVPSEFIRVSLIHGDSGVSLAAS